MKFASSCYKQGYFNASAAHYDSAFKRFDGFPEDYYAAARVNQLAGSEQRVESLLRSAVRRGFMDLDQLRTDSVLKPYRKKPRNEALMLALEDTILVRRERLDLQLIKRLEKLRILDQEPRSLLSRLGEHLADTSQQIMDLWPVIRYLDRMNVDTLEKIIAEFGFPGMDMVGPEGNKTVWLVLQHADVDVMERYNDMFRHSCEQGLTPMKYYAYFYDRLLILRGNTKVKYGCVFARHSDGQYYMDLEDPGCINRIRESVGLEPLDSYRGEENCSK
ncbi:MAG: DUF6624 domain-containing protein [Flavobacteriales bacterium]